MGAYCVVRWAHPGKDVPRYTVVLHDSSVAASVHAGAVMVVRDGMTLSEAQQEAASWNQNGQPADPSSRRIAQRYAFETRFRINLRRDTRNLNWEGWARDLSESGLAAFVGQTLYLGEEVTLEIPLLGAESLQLPARVSRCLGTQYGFQFTTLTAAQRRRIQAAVRGKPLLSKPSTNS